MENVYQRLGFKTPDFLENEYGIKIYLGTVGKCDWGVEVPNEICQYRLKHGLTYYLITEAMALEVAEKWTNIARRKHDKR